MTGKKPTGITRIIKATRYSAEGIKAAWKHEAAFRQELFALSFLLPIGLLLGQTGLERAVLIVSLMIVIVAELLNSALEAAVDRIGQDVHPLSKQAKDLGSAAVFVSLVMVIITWALILI